MCIKDSSYVVARSIDSGDNPNLRDFRMGLISDLSLQFNVTEDERIKAATGMRYMIDWNAYKDSPGPAPHYYGGGFFLSILGSL
jgi:hypothetical protein